MTQDEIPKPEGPDKRVTDMLKEAERILKVTERAFGMHDIDDTTPESLKMSSKEAQKLRNGGFTDEQMARRAGGSNGPNQPVPTGTSLLR